MSILFETIEKEGNGAQFYTADLHVHSFGGSPDVKDATMTVEAIVDTAVKQGVAIVAITDHNTDRNTHQSIDYARKYAGKLLVLAGVEVTTAHGHLLVYFGPEQPEKLTKFLARLDIVGAGGSESHTTKSMSDTIREAEALGGICVAAHIDRTKTGFELLAAGYPNWKKDILASSGLYGLEVDKPDHLIWYSGDDEANSDGAERRKLWATRSKSSATAARLHLAHVQNSDAHKLVDFAAGRSNRVLTRYKMNELSFEGFRSALVDPEARVRATATIPRAFPRVRGMHVSGGFLDMATFHFSDNLNCFIGGRGAGKSTALQSLAYGLGMRDTLEEHDNCPDAVVVYCDDADGVRYRYERQRGNGLSVKAKEDGSILEVPDDAFRVEFYGQNELSDVAKDPLRNPELLQEFLDRHLTLRDLEERESGILATLKQNSAQLIPIEGRHAERPAKAKAIADINAKLKIAEEGKLKDIAALQARIGAEKSLHTAASEVSGVYAAGVSLAAWLRDYAKLVNSAGNLTGDARSAEPLADVKAVFDETNAFVRLKETELNAGLKASAARLDKALAALKKVHSALDQETAAKISDLQKQGLSGSLSELNGLIKKKGVLVTEVGRLDAEQAQLEKLRKERKELLGKLADVRTELVERRKGQLTAINRNLAKAIDDYSVFLHYDPSGIATDVKNLVMSVMQGSWYQEESVDKLCAGATPERIAQLVAARDVRELTKLPGVGANWAQAIVDRFQTLTHLHALEVLWKPPRPTITVRLKAGKAREIPVNQLSDGQKHTILLTIAMLGESHLPLVIDQPEDDLDNAFIFTSVVASLREVKERRQVILITHNANIAVLGDAELLFPMKRNGDGGVVGERGSIDRPETKQAVQQVLEGGELAFRRRKEIYGY